MWVCTSVCYNFFEKNKNYQASFINKPHRVLQKTKP